MLNAVQYNYLTCLGVHTIWKVDIIQKSTIRLQNIKNPLCNKKPGHITKSPVYNKKPGHMTKSPVDVTKSPVDVAKSPVPGFLLSEI